MLVVNQPRRLPRVAALTRPARLPATAVFGLPAALLLVLGAIQLHRHLGLWYDEDYTLLAVQTPLPKLLSAVWNSAPLVSWLTVAPSFNAPWYVLMHGWAALFGSSTLALRIPALLCSAAAVGVLGLVVRRLAGSAAGLTAALLAATGPLLAQQAVEARSYGAAELATALTALFLVRRVQDGGRLWPVGVAACAAGLMHWFTLPVLAGFALWALVAKGRRGWSEALTIAVASIPALALVEIQISGGGDGTPIAGVLGLSLPEQAVIDWADGAWFLAIPLVGLFAVALVRSRWRALLACWVLVPLALITALELVRPVYFSRYLLFALLGLAAGAALGAFALPGRWRALAATGLVAVSFAACVPRLQATPREHQDQVVAMLEAQETPGQVIAAGDGRAALELEEQVRVTGSRIASDLLLRPAHVPVGGSATVAWVVRSGSGDTLVPTPNAAYLKAGGWRLAATLVFPGTHGDLTVERWVR